MNNSDLDHVAELASKLAERTKASLKAERSAAKKPARKSAARK
jgi:hypothetical protein